MSAVAGSCRSPQQLAGRDRILRAVHPLKIGEREHELAVEVARIRGARI